MEERKNSFDKLPMHAKAHYILKNISVEPMFVCYILGIFVSNLAMQNLNLEKACRVNLDLNDAVCTAMLAKEEAADGYCEMLYRLRDNETGPDLRRNAICFAEEVSQREVTSMDIWKSFLSSLMPAILIMFVGAWSDRNRTRKPAMLVPICGELLTVSGYILCTIFFNQFPMEVSGAMDAIFPAVTGGSMTMFLAVFSFMGDSTSLESRTFRIGILKLCSSISGPLGTSLSGILYKWIGYYGVFGLAGILHLTAIVLGWKLVPRESVEAAERTSSIEIRDTKRSRLVYFLRDFFDVRHIRDSLKVTFKKGQHNHRLKVVSLLATVILTLGPLQGEMNVLYNFTRLRFNWNEVDYSYFLTFIMVINLIGTSITVGVLSHMMKIDDAIIGIISCMSKILAGFIYAFATTTWMMYLAPIVDIANGTSYIAMRSIASKLVPTDELGKLNSVFGMAEAIVPVIYGPMYNAIYNATRQSVPGAFYLVGGALTAPAVFIFLWLYGQHKQDAARLAKENSEKGDISEKKTNIEVEKDKNGTMEMVNLNEGESSHNNEAFQQDNENTEN